MLDEIKKQLNLIEAQVSDLRGFIQNLQRDSSDLIKEATRKTLILLTEDPHEPKLREPAGELGLNAAYLVLPAAERRMVRNRPYRTSYRHIGQLVEADSNRQQAARPCNAATTIARPIAETFAAQPSFYASTYCSSCHTHLPIKEFVWEDDGSVVGS